MERNKVITYAKPTPGESGAPTGVDEYAAWFNQTFTFAKAIFLLMRQAHEHKHRKD